MLALIGAIDEEISGFRKKMVIEETVRSDAGLIYRGRYYGKPVLLAQSGPGKVRAERMARLILDEYKPVALVSLGFAGALTAKTKVGEIFICASLGCENSGEAIYRSDVNLVAASLRAVNGRLNLQEGKTVTAGKIVGTPELKQQLGRASGAAIVEMESYWIARLAYQKVPFLAVRAISDTARQRLPPLERLVKPDGSLGKLKALCYFISHPSSLKMMFTLNKNMRRARANLTEFMGRLVVEAG